MGEKNTSSEEIEILARFPVENPNPVLRITADGTIIYANDGSEPLLKAWDCQVGQRLPDNWRGFASDVLSSGDGRDTEVVCGKRIFLVSFLPSVDAGYIYAYGNDITERKRAEVALRESEEMYRTIFETTGSAGIIVEEDTTIFLANTEFEKLSGYSREEIEGKKSWKDFVPEDSLEKMAHYSNLREADPDTAPMNCECQLINRDGEIRDYLITTSVMPATQKSIVFMVDITEHKEETERIQVAKMRALRELVAGLAHQMNNPMGVISSNNDISQRAVSKIRTILSEEYSQKVETDKELTKVLAVLEDMDRGNQNATENIAKVVVNLQRFVKLDEAEWQFADVHEGMDNVIALMESDFSDQIKVTKDYGDLPKIYCSPSSLNQVIMILLKNASEAIDGEGEISISTAAQGEYIKITVSDTGRGIPTEYLSRIFDPGFTTKGVNVGVGLGLPICHKIVVDEHKGHIDVSSEPGIGTTFTITLPQYRDRP